VMYTDGVTERNPLVDELAGLAPLLKPLAGRDAASMLAALSSAALAGQALKDDAAIFVLANSPQPAPAATTAISPQLDVSYPAVAGSIPLARSQVAAYASEAGGAPEEVLERVRLAVSEAVTNAVIHAYPGDGGSVRVSAAVHADELTITVTDDGCGYLKPTTRASLGVGLSVIAEVCDHFTIAEPPRGGTEAGMRFNLRAARSPSAGDDDRSASAPARVSRAR